MKETYTSISYPYLENDIIHIDQELYLEPISLTVLKPLYKLMDKDRDYLSQFLPWAPKQTQESLQKFIEISIENRQLKHEFVYVIRKNKDILGCITLLNYKGSAFGLPGHANIGYYLFSEFQGLGYMKKAILALTSLYYINHNINRFQIEIRGENLKSINVAKSIGAKYEGIARKLNGYDNMHVYSYILPEDFINHNQQIEQNAKAYAKESRLGELEIPNAIYESSVESGNVETGSSNSASNPPQGNVEGFGNVNIIVGGKRQESGTSVNLENLENLDSTVNTASAVNTNNVVSTAREVNTNNETDTANTQVDKNFSFNVSDEDLIAASAKLAPAEQEKLLTSLEANLESTMMTASDFTAGVFGEALQVATESNQSAPKAPVVNSAQENDLDDIVDEALLAEISGQK